jgi:hypothetical protein
VRITALFLFLLLFYSCRKESFTSDPNALLRVEADTLHFDTVFSATGSITQRVKFFNENSKGIHVSSILLKGGQSSPFKINVNGAPGPLINGMDIAADDSAYVFVSVTVNPTATNLPFLIQDSIEINYNGNKKMMQLQAYGQNAHFYKDKTLTASAVWNNDLPYVILGGLEIEAGVKLLINKGCKIYFHSNAALVVKGTLEVLGAKGENEKVLFTGDRLDDPYKDFPASWPGIYFLNTSKDNVINYATISNAYQAVVVQAPSVNNNPKLQLSQTVVTNAFDAGILGVNTSIKAQNLLVSNCGKNLVLVNGGEYSFTHCTIASFSSILLRHKDPLLLLSNFLNNAPPNALNANFKNTIIWGDTAARVEHEIVVSRNGGVSNVVFDHVLWNEKTNPVNVTNVFAAKTGYPQFDSISPAKNFYDFRLKDSSPAINAGTNTLVTSDLDGKVRPVGLPDLGSYEEQ